MTKMYKRMINTTLAIISLMIAATGAGRLGNGAKGITDSLATRAHPAQDNAIDCRGGLGGRVFSTGAAVEVEILPAEANFTSEIYLYSPGPQRFIGTNKEAGKVVNLGTFPRGTEL